VQLRKSTLPSRISKSRQGSPLFALRALFSVALFIIAIIAAAAVSEAAEHDAAPAAEHEAAPEGEHATEAPKKVKSGHRWSEHESRLTSYMAKIRTLEKEISDMIESKHHIESSERVRILTQQIAFKHADLAKVVRDYEAERLHVRFQHPDRDQELEREYSAHRLKSIDEMETAFGLDGRLDRIRRQVGIVFPVSDPNAADRLRQPASVEPKEEESDMPESIHLVK
jgi:hypothetical protein